MVTLPPIRSALLKCIATFAVICTWVTLVHASEPPQLKTASNHPIQYYLSLPDGWTAAKKWPVVVVIDSADRQFLQAATAFAEARRHQPFIIVTPLVVTNGGTRYRSVPTYHYSDAVWDRVEKSGPFNFDLDGITAIMQDVIKQYGGEEKYFITGLEAAGHTIWGIIFNHPEVLRAAAIVCSNYLGRWVDETRISSAAERGSLPVRNFVGTKDTLCGPGYPIYTQMQKAISVAEAHGYKNVSVKRVEGKGHERLADEVLAYFSSLHTMTAHSGTLSAASCEEITGNTSNSTMSDQLAIHSFR
jgi:poly(3-hydroxybutyrate) depolymerase